MVNIFRKHQKSLMAAVTVVVIISFIWLYNRTQFEQIGRGRIGTLYGKDLTVGDLDRSQRMFQLGIELGFYEWAQALAGMTPDRSAEQFFLNSAVVAHESEKLRIAPSDASVMETIRGLRRFQTNRQFDPNKFAAFIQEELAPRGFTQTQLEEVVKSALALSMLKNIIGSTVEVSPSEVRALCDIQFRKHEASIVRFKTEEFAPGVAVSDEEIAGAFEARKDQFRSDEKRKIRYVKLSLDPEQAKLEKRDRTAALQALADKGQAFAESLLAAEANFDAAAARAGLPVAATGAFSIKVPDPALAAERELLPAIFAIPADQPDSDVIQSGESFFVVHLDEIVPSHPLALEEAKPDVEKQLREEKARQAMEAAAADLRKAVEGAMQSGKTFEQAVADVGRKAEKLAAFSIADVRGEVGPPVEVALKVPEMKEGELSGFVPGGEGGFLVRMEKRLPLDEDQFLQEKGRVEMLLGDGRRNAAFAEWLRLRREEAGGLAVAVTP
jgi:hypothetical protein